MSTWAERGGCTGSGAGSLMTTDGIALLRSSAAAGPKNASVSTVANNFITTHLSLEIDHHAARNCAGNIARGSGLKRLTTSRDFRAKRQQRLVNVCLRIENVCRKSKAIEVTLFAHLHDDAVPAEQRVSQPHAVDVTRQHACEDRSGHGSRRRPNYAQAWDLSQTFVGTGAQGDAVSFDLGHPDVLHPLNGCA